mgnify:CR=1 FL=1
MFVNFKLDSFSNRFHAQFDTGSKSFFKENTITSFINYNIKLSNKVDSLLGEQKINSIPVKYALRNLNLKFKDTSIINNKTLFYPNAGRKFTKEEFGTSRIHLGTLGVDLLKDKILIMDYSLTKLAVLEYIPSKFKIKKSISFALDNINRIYLPIKIKDTFYYVLFDTGSSIFSLITSQENIWKKVEKDSVIDTLSVSSFGRYYDVYSSKIKEDIYIMDLNLKGENIHYSTRPKEEIYINEVKVIGTTGNKMFLDKIIAINYKNHTLNILEK